MLVSDVFSWIDQLAPFSYAMDFDNSGLLVGNPSQPVEKILVVLDCTPAVVHQAVEAGAGLIVTHHPVIFDPLKQITAGSVVYQLVSAGIAVICAHTNLDLARGGVNDALARRLGLKCLEGLTPVSCTDREGRPVTEYLGRVSFIPEPMAPGDFARFVKKQLGGNVRYTCGNRPVHRVAVCGGAGADCLADALSTGADALVTSEVKHHIFLLAAQHGLTLVDAGHFHTENVVIEPLCQQIRDYFPQAEVIAHHLDEIQVL
ncbi:MAG: Nif3-like dinuclear metal center hexameric protein [Oscillospiraceae bacterium]|nr:Nif3-like dinuclear metal center hexameric protein [Oscillospiraceae bacterium]